MSEKGLIHVYYGDGKGKTTAALGLAVRAAGCGKNVVIVQFLKGWNCGEHKTVSQIPNIEFIRGKPVSNKFIFEMTEEEKQETKASHDESLQKAIDLIKSDKCDLLVMDEAIEAFSLKVLDSELILGLIDQKPDALEIIITGHNPEPTFIDRADYITEMKKHKHPYDKGIQARRGIEF